MTPPADQPPPSRPPGMTAPASDQDFTSNPPTRDELLAMITAHPWYFAKTMADNPHEYTLRASSPSRRGWDNHPLFDRFVNWIRHAGTREKYGSYWYQVWYFEEYKYWTMGAPVAETILVNRKHQQFYRRDYPTSTADTASPELRRLLAGEGEAATAEDGEGKGTQR